ncbi:hypothetical protein AA0242T_3064 [Acetobacter aceti NRIC 0242]|uniref:Acetoacetate decarboxylase n=2 Tax=Acetobacter aceti TaxID=435 RepID=A0AB33IJ63_ACEAC|nr:acetoacetate decarboxylase family protein [Acetobacter aceti]BCK77093.1 acetoacetate decarboxylase [Acetobacter aceti NBRC 14818]GAN57298.1 hypothetical protein Abac_016_011 [Acetobacter aceti NBRC 14818]GBO82362.1 hypothetical protein AA0242T_3064 [Acetobacter aceti NRIC 0242]
MTDMDGCTIDVEFGGHKIPVLAGGYYDRFRSNPDLDAIARDPAAGNIDFFRRIPKQKIESRIGPVWAPNFYYRSSSVQLLMPAPVSRLKAILPEPLEPLRACPGYGLVALTFFSYAVCDNDPYDEASIAIVIRRPGAWGPHALELAAAIRRRSFHAHVLALPVTTEISRVRGVECYQLPKWLAGISVTIGAEVRAATQAPDGTPDLTLRAPAPDFVDVPSQSHMGANTMIHQIAGRWHRTTVRSNTLSFAQRMLPRDVTLSRHGGPMSDLLGGLGVARPLRLDVVRDAQLVLNMPEPFTMPGSG